MNMLTALKGSQFFVVVVFINLNMICRLQISTLIDSMQDLYYMSRVMRKPDFNICENKGADQLRSNSKTIKTADSCKAIKTADSSTPILLLKI